LLYLDEFLTSFHHPLTLVREIKRAILQRVALYFICAIIFITFSSMEK
jgi:hypothetical protein